MGRTTCFGGVALWVLAVVGCSDTTTTTTEPPPIQKFPNPPSEEPSCTSYQKLCGQACQPTSFPEYGCEESSCEPCPSNPHQPATCADDGKCALAACEKGFDNCDADDANGCETPVTDDVDNCGSCGAVCETPDHASPGCSAGACFLTCEKGFYDNDGVYANGCEANVYNPLDPIATLVADKPVCAPHAPRDRDECSDFQATAYCEYTNPALNCHCSASCDYPPGVIFGPVKPSWSVECHYCGAPKTESWELGFKSATLGDFGTVTAPQEPLTVYYNQCDTFYIDTDKLLADCGNAYIPADVRKQSDGSEVAVFYFGDLTFDDSTKLDIRGSRPLALVAKSINVNATLSIRNWLTIPGPLPGTGQDAPPVMSGDSSGSGAGHCTAGGKSGTGALGGMAFADESKPLLAFGALGGRSDVDIIDDGPNPVPEYRDAGGAIQLIASTSITIGEKAELSVSGYQGSSKLNRGSGGGASGGTIILEAPSITVDGYLSAVGGDGGNEFTSPAGSDGTGPGQAGGDTDEGGGAGAGVILIYGDQVKVFAPRMKPATSTPCAEIRQLLR